MNDIWDKNWVINTSVDRHPELVNLVKQFAGGKRILEVGFGTGGDLMELAGYGFDCFGIETSKIAFHRARNQKYFKALFQSGEHTTFNDDQFDLIFHQGVLEHFKNPYKLLIEHGRILKNDGVIVIDVPHKWNPFTLYKNFKIIFNNWYGGWERSYSASELTKLVTKSGFEPIEIVYRGIWPHQWGKFLFPEKIVKKKWLTRVLSSFPVNFLQKLLRKIYDNSKIVQVLSSYNIMIVARKKRLRIGFDGRYAEGDLVGVGKYIRELVYRLSKNEIECIIFYSRSPKIEISGKNIKSVVLKRTNRYVFEQILLQYGLRKEKADLYHATGNVGIPLFCPVPSILTIHDIIPLEIKDYFSYSALPVVSKLSYLSRLKTSLWRSTKIVTVSNYVKEELTRRMGIDTRKIKTIYSGAPVIVEGGRLPKYLIGQKYILNHGGIDIRKNLDKLIEAFAIFHQKHADVKLVITGENPRIKNKLTNLLISTDLINNVIFTGYVDEKTLWAIIKNAVVICYPTISEGFGFPILEGFSADIPVISSNTSSIPEVADDAAVLVDPNDIGEIESVLEKVFKNKKFREKMILNGKKQYDKFDWTKSINGYLDLYKFTIQNHK